MCVLKLRGRVALRPHILRTLLGYKVSQAPLSMGFSRQESWSRWPFPSPGDLPDPGIKTHLLLGRRIFFFFLLTPEPPGKPLQINIMRLNGKSLYKKWWVQCYTYWTAQGSSFFPFTIYFLLFVFHSVQISLVQHHGLSSFLLHHPVSCLPKLLLSHLDSHSFHAHKDDWGY